MNLIKPDYAIESWTDLSLIEKAGRTCYKSEDKMTEVSLTPFIRGILKRGHESVLEHSMLSVRFIVDRGVTHELVRHRLMAFSQESTRYCNYSGGVTFIIPPWVDINPGEYIGTWPRSKDMPTNIWADSMLMAENQYVNLLHFGWSPQQARSVLPNSLKTEIVATANFREWRHIFKLRAVGTSGTPHPQMSEVMIPLLKEVKQEIPIIFDDLEV
jgi:thymidylate synthase (FAD)